MRTLFESNLDMRQPDLFVHGERPVVSDWKLNIVLMEGSIVSYDLKLDDGYLLNMVINFSKDNTSSDLNSLLFNFIDADADYEVDDAESARYNFDTHYYVYGETIEGDMEVMEDLLSDVINLPDDLIEDIKQRVRTFATANHP